MSHEVISDDVPQAAKEAAQRVVGEVSSWQHSAENPSAPQVRAASPVG